MFVVFDISPTLTRKILESQKTLTLIFFPNLKSTPVTFADKHEENVCGSCRKGINPLSSSAEVQFVNQHILLSISHLDNKVKDCVEKDPIKNSLIINQCRVRAAGSCNIHMLFSKILSVCILRKLGKQSLLYQPKGYVNIDRI